MTRAITLASRLHNKSAEALLYLTAHMLALEEEQIGAETRNGLEPDGGAGVVTSEQIGPRRIDYLTQAGDDERRAFYVTTSYGRTFLALEDRSPGARIAAMVV